MSQDTSTFTEFADATSAAAGLRGDIQRHVVIPAMLEMIGAVDGKDVLDLHCGAGYLSRRLAALGAQVTAVDASDRLVGIAREINHRESCNIRYAVAEPTDLSVVEDSAFDDIVCNMGLMATRDLAGTVAELARLVKLGGRFVFSVVHPCFFMPDACWVKDDQGRELYRSVDNYFTEGWWMPEAESAYQGEHKKVKHRPMSRYVNALAARGFTIRRMLEPRPSPEALILKPQLDICSRVPMVLVFEAVFPYL